MGNKQGTEKSQEEKKRLKAEKERDKLFAKQEKERKKKEKKDEKRRKKQRKKAGYIEEDEQSVGSGWSDKSQISERSADARSVGSGPRSWYHSASEPSSRRSSLYLPANSGPATYYQHCWYAGYDDSSSERSKSGSRTSSVKDIKDPSQLRTGSLERYPLGIPSPEAIEPLQQLYKGGSLDLHSAAAIEYLKEIQKQRQEGSSGEESIVVASRYEETIKATSDKFQKASKERLALLEPDNILLLKKEVELDVPEGEKRNAEDDTQPQKRLATENNRSYPEAVGLKIPEAVGLKIPEAVSLKIPETVGLEIDNTLLKSSEDPLPIDQMSHDGSAYYSADETMRHNVDRSSATGSIYYTADEGGSINGSIYYSLTSGSEVGDWRDRDIMEEDRPSPPSKPEAVDREGIAVSTLVYFRAENDALLLRWHAPVTDGGSPITGYLIERSEDESDCWVRVNLIPIQRLEFVIAHLQGGVNYRFRVLAINDYGTSEPSPVSEVVSVPSDQEVTEPHFLKELRDIVAVENQKVEFTVDIIGSPTPDVTWYKDGFELFDTQKYEFRQVGYRYSLVLLSCQNSDGGDIRVRATNRVGVAASQAVLRIETLPQLRIPPNYEKGQIFESDEVIRLQIPYSGKPKPTAIWTKNGKTIENDEKHSMDVTEKFVTLKVTSATRSDKGIYSVSLRNSQGEATSSLFVTVTDRPEPPSKPRITDVTGQNVTLRWDPPVDDGGGRVDSYVIEYFRLDWNIWLKATSSHITWTQLSDLIIGSEYRFRVKAENSYGISDPGPESEPILIEEGPSSTGSFESDANKAASSLKLGLSGESSDSPSAEGSFDKGGKYSRKGNLEILGSSEESAEMAGKSMKRTYSDEITEPHGPIKRTHREKLDTSNDSTYDEETLKISSHYSENDSSLDSTGLITLKASYLKGLGLPEELEELAYEDELQYESKVSQKLGRRTSKNLPETTSISETEIASDQEVAFDLDSSVDVDAFLGDYMGRWDAYAGRTLSELPEEALAAAHVINKNEESPQNLQMEHTSNECPPPTPPRKKKIKSSECPWQGTLLRPDLLDKDAPVPPPRLKRSRPSSRGSIVSESSLLAEEEGCAPTPPPRIRRTGSRTSLDSGKVKFSQPEGTIDPISKLIFQRPSSGEPKARMEEVNVGIGGEAILVVALDGISVTDIVWRKSGEQLVPSPHYSTSSTSHSAQLVIHQATSTDSGTYTAIVTKPDGSQVKASIDLCVSPTILPSKPEPPLFLRPLPDLSAKVGTRVRFLAELRSSHDVCAFWYHNNLEVQPSPRMKILHEGNFFCVDISPLSTEDEGTWKCLAVNATGQAASTASLGVTVPKGYKPPIFLEGLEALLTAEGTVSLECKVVGVPTPILKWYKDGNEIKAGDVFALTADPDDPTSLGTYTCEAINCMGRASSSSKVRVVSREPSRPSSRMRSSPIPIGPPPKFIEELEDKKVKIGERTKFTIKVLVPPDVQSVTWYNNGKLIENSSKYRISDEGGSKYSIEIGPLEIGDDGEWKVVLKSEGGYSASSCKLTLAVPRNYRAPKFLENLRALLTEEGLVSFECKVVGYPTPLLKWFKDGQELKPGDVYQLSGTNSLGKYSCIAKNCMGEAKSTAELTLEDIKYHLNDEERIQLLAANVPPRFIQPLRSNEVTIGEPTRLSVQITMDNPPAVTWYRNDEIISESPKYKPEAADNGFFYLHILSTDITDQTEWTCEAKNDYGHSVSSSVVKLTIPRHFKKPIFLESLQATLSPEGTVNLECKVIGVPQPVLQWLKDGKELKAGDIHRIISGKGGICCLGTYTCLAQNCMGSATSSAVLHGFEDEEKGAPKQDPKVFQPAESQGILRHPSLSTINEERSSQISVYESAVDELTMEEEEKLEISVSIDGKEVFLSLNETPDISEADAKQIAEIYEEEISDHVLVHNHLQAELPPLRFTKETSRQGPIIIDAMVIDIEDQCFDEYLSMSDIPFDDLRTEADIEELSIMEPIVVDEREALRSDIADLPELEMREGEAQQRTIASEAKGVAEIREVNVIDTDLRSLSEQGLLLLQSEGILSSDEEEKSKTEKMIMKGSEVKPPTPKKKQIKVSPLDLQHVAESQEQVVLSNIESLSEGRVQREKAVQSLEVSNVAIIEQQEHLSQATSMSDERNIPDKKTKANQMVDALEAVGITEPHLFEKPSGMVTEERLVKRLRPTNSYEEAMKNVITIDDPVVMEGERDIYSYTRDESRHANVTISERMAAEIEGIQVYDELVTLSETSLLEDNAAFVQSQKEGLIMHEIEVENDDRKAFSTSDIQYDNAEEHDVSAFGLALQHQQDILSTIQDIPQFSPAEETDIDNTDTHSFEENTYISEALVLESLQERDDNRELDFIRSQTYHPEDPDYYFNIDNIVYIDTNHESPQEYRSFEENPDQSWDTELMNQFIESQYKVDYFSDNQEDLIVAEPSSSRVECIVAKEPELQVAGVFHSKESVATSGDVSTSIVSGAVESAIILTSPSIKTLGNKSIENVENAVTLSSHSTESHDSRQKLLIDEQKPNDSDLKEASESKVLSDKQPKIIKPNTLQEHIEKIMFGYEKVEFAQNIEEKKARCIARIVTAVNQAKIECLQQVLSHGLALNIDEKVIYPFISALDEILSGYGDLINLDADSFDQLQTFLVSVICPEDSQNSSIANVHHEKICEGAPEIDDKYLELHSSQKPSEIIKTEDHDTSLRQNVLTKEQLTIKREEILAKKKELLEKQLKMKKDAEESSTSDLTSDISSSDNDTLADEPSTNDDASEVDSVIENFGTFDEALGEISKEPEISCVRQSKKITESDFKGSELLIQGVLKDSEKSEEEQLIISAIKNIPQNVAAKMFEILINESNQMVESEKTGTDIKSNESKIIEKHASEQLISLQGSLAHEEVPVNLAIKLQESAARICEEATPNLFIASNEPEISFVQQSKEITESDSKGSELLIQGKKGSEKSEEEQLIISAIKNIPQNVAAKMFEILINESNQMVESEKTGTDIKSNESKIIEKHASERLISLQEFLAHEEVPVNLAIKLQESAARICEEATPNLFIASNEPEISFVQQSKEITESDSKGSELLIQGKKGSEKSEEEQLIISAIKNIPQNVAAKMFEILINESNQMVESEKTGTDIKSNESKIIEKHASERLISLQEFLAHEEVPVNLAIKLQESAARICEEATPNLFIASNEPEISFVQQSKEITESDSKGSELLIQGKKGSEKSEEEQLIISAIKNIPQNVAAKMFEILINESNQMVESEKTGTDIKSNESKIIEKHASERLISLQEFLAHEEVPVNLAIKLQESAARICEEATPNLFIASNEPEISFVQQSKEITESDSKGGELLIQGKKGSEKSEEEQLIISAIKNIPQNVAAKMFEILINESNQMVESEKIGTDIKSNESKIIEKHASEQLISLQEFLAHEEVPVNLAIKLQESAARICEEATPNLFIASNEPEISFVQQSKEITESDSKGSELLIQGKKGSEKSEEEQLIISAIKNIPQNVAAKMFEILINESNQIVESEKTGTDIKSNESKILEKHASEQLISLQGFLAKEEVPVNLAIKLQESAARICEEATPNLFIASNEQDLKLQYSDSEKNQQTQDTSQNLSATLLEVLLTQHYLQNESTIDNETANSALHKPDDQNELVNDAVNFATSHLDESRLQNSAEILLLNQTPPKLQVKDENYIVSREEVPEKCQSKSEELICDDNANESVPGTMTLCKGNSSANDSVPGTMTPFKGNTSADESVPGTMIPFKGNTSANESVSEAFKTPSQIESIETHSETGKATNSDNLTQLKQDEETVDHALKYAEINLKMDINEKEGLNYNLLATEGRTKSFNETGLIDTTDTNKCLKEITFEDAILEKQIKSKEEILSDSFQPETIREDRGNTPSDFTDTIEIDESRELRLSSQDIDVKGYKQIEVTESTELTDETSDPILLRNTVLQVDKNKTSEIANQKHDIEKITILNLEGQSIKMNIGSVEVMEKNGIISMVGADSAVGMQEMECSEKISSELSDTEKNHIKKVQKAEIVMNNMKQEQLVKQLNREEENNKDHFEKLDHEKELFFENQESIPEEIAADETMFTEQSGQDKEEWKEHMNQHTPNYEISYQLQDEDLQLTRERKEISEGISGRDIDDDDDNHMQSSKRMEQNKMKLTTDEEYEEDQEKKTAKMHEKEMIKEKELFQELGQASSKEKLEEKDEQKEQLERFELKELNLSEIDKPKIKKELQEINENVLFADKEFQAQIQEEREKKTERIMESELEAHDEAEHVLKMKEEREHRTTKREKEEKEETQTDESVKMTGKLEREQIEKEKNISTKHEKNEKEIEEKLQKLSKDMKNIIEKKEDEKIQKDEEDYQDKEALKEAESECERKEVRKQEGNKRIADESKACKEKMETEKRVREENFKKEQELLEKQLQDERESREKLQRERKQQWDEEALEQETKLREMKEERERKKKEIESVEMEENKKREELRRQQANIKNQREEEEKLAEKMEREKQEQEAKNKKEKEKAKAQEEAERKAMEERQRQENLEKRERKEKEESEKENEREAQAKREKEEHILKRKKEEEEEREKEKLALQLQTEEKERKYKEEMERKRREREDYENKENEALNRQLQEREQKRKQRAIQQEEEDRKLREEIEAMQKRRTEREEAQRKQEDEMKRNDDERKKTKERQMEEEIVIRKEAEKAEGAKQMELEIKRKQDLENKKNEEKARFEQEEREIECKRRQKREGSERLRKEEDLRYQKEEGERFERKRRKQAEDELLEKKRQELLEAKWRKEEEERRKARERRWQEREDEERRLEEEEEKRRERIRKLAEDEKKRKLEEEKMRNFQIKQLEIELQNHEAFKKKKDDLRRMGEEILKKEEERLKLKETNRKKQEEETPQEQEPKKRDFSKVINYSDTELIDDDKLAELMKRRAKMTSPELDPNRRDPRRKPKFSTKLQDRQTLKNTRIKLTCSILTSPEDSNPEIEWFKNGYPIKEDDRVTMIFVDGLASLELDQVMRTDAGEYTCTATNRHGRVSTSCDLRVKGEEDHRPTAPTFTTSLRERYSSEEDELVISCHVTGHPTPKIKWLKDEDQLPVSSRFQTSMSEEGICKLIIKNPRAADSGVYICHAENRVYRDEIKSHIPVQAILANKDGKHERALVDDSEAPRFVSELFDQNVQENGTLSLQVEVAGNPSPEVVWLFNGRSLPPSGKCRVSASDRTHTLTVFQVARQDLGTYSCKIKNKYGQAYTLSTVSFGSSRMNRDSFIDYDQSTSDVEGFCEPTFVEKPDSLITVGRNEEIRLSCIVKGEPTPRVTWYRGHHDLAASGRAYVTVRDRRHTILMRDAQFTDTGTFTVEAKNSQGTCRAYCSIKVRELHYSRSDSPHLAERNGAQRDEHDIQINRRSGRYIRDVPGKVGIPRATDIGKNWVSLRWEKPEHAGGAPVTAFKVESWILGEEARWQELGVSPISSFDAYHMKTDHEYLFRVTPRNKYGWGEPVITPQPVRVGRTVEPPSMAKSLPVQIRCMPGGTVILEGQVTGDPTPEIRWYKDGALLDTSRYPRFATNLSDGNLHNVFGFVYKTSLHIDDLQPQDEGRYEVEAVNPGGRVTSATKVIPTYDCSVLEAQETINRSLIALSRLDQVVSMAPQFTMRLRDRRVQRGFPVRLTCQIVGSPKPAVKWLKDGDEISHDTSHTIWQEDGHFYTLEISSANQEDAAVYSVEAKNDFGSVVCKCRLIVDSGLKSYLSPMLLKELEDISVKEKEDIVLQTVIEAYPTVGVVWHRDGQRIRPSRKHIFSLGPDGEAQLVVKNAEYLDGGLYTCTASNEMGRIETYCRVSVATNDPSLSARKDQEKLIERPMFVRKPRTIDAEEGDLVIIECEVAGDPKPSVKWLRDWLDPSVYVDGARFKRVGSGPVYRLEIPNCRVEDTGAYSILASNEHGETKAVISLQVYAKGLKKIEGGLIKKGVMEHVPRVVRPLQDVRCCDGDSVTLEALIDAPETSLIRWEKGGKVLKSSAEVTHDWEGSVARLRIREVYPEDEGEYSCIVFNDLGKAVTSATIVVEMAEDKENDVTVQMDYRPEMSRRTTPSRTPTPTRYSQSPTFQREGSAHSWAGVGWREPSLPISHWRPLSRGSSPLLLAQRRAAMESSARSKQRRAQRPKFYYIPHDRIVEEGATVTFQCAVKGIPIPRATWDKDSRKILPGGRIKMEERKEIRTLEIPKVTQQDAGLYRITIDNDLGREQATARLDVIKASTNKYLGYVRSWHTSPLTVPRFNRTFPSATLREGSMLTLETEFRGSPTPRVKWYRNGNFLPLCDEFKQTTDGRKASLRLTVTSSDSGTYSCVLVNKAGKAECSAQVVVEHREERRWDEPHFLLPLQDADALDGDEVRLQVKIGGTRPLKVLWVRNDREIKHCKDFLCEEGPDGRYSLVIADAFPKDSGIYFCEAYNTHGYSVCHARLSVQDPTAVAHSVPKILAPLAPLSVAEGEAARFSLRLTGHPEPKVTWYLNEKELKETNQIKLGIDESDNGDGMVYSLGFISPSSVDSGVVSVVATNSQGRTSLQTSFKVEKLKCQSRDSSASNQSKHSETRHKPGVITKSTLDPESKQSRVSPVRTTPKRPITNRHCLIKEKSTSRDSAYCSGRSSSMSVSSDIEIKENIQNSETQTSTQTPVETEKSLETKISTVKPLETETNSKEQLEIKHSSEKVLESKLGSQSSAETDLGIQKSAKEPLETAIPSPQSNKVVDEESEFLGISEEDTGAVIISGPNDTTVLKGQVATLKAAFKGNPKPDVIWYKKDKEIKEGGRYTIKVGRHMTSLSINQVTFDDCDKYTLKVRNSISAHSSYASLAVEGIPEPPAGKPNLSEVTQSSVTVSWYGPTYDGGRIVIGYKVEGRKIGNVDWETFAERCNSTSFKVKDLEKRAQYEFRISTENVHGLSEPSKTSNPISLLDKYEDSASELSDEEAENKIPEGYKLGAVTLENGDIFSQRFEQHEEVGKGRFGVVYKVSEKATGKRRAAKFIKCIRQEERKKVRDEIAIMNSLRHPKLLQLLAAFERKRDCIMIMEYISGGELFERVVADDFALTERDCILFIRQICEGVAYIHANSIVHLDLKPENILCVRRSSDPSMLGSHQIKLIDFGLARKLDPNVPCRVLFGTPEFVAPEIISYEPISFSSDMWSVGVICYVLLSGLSPFMGENDTETFANITRAEFDFDDESFDAISEDAKDFIRRLLDKRKDKRPSAAQCLQCGWLAQPEKSMKKVVIPTDKLKRFIIRRKWQKTGNAIRALGRMANLTNQRNSSPTRLSPFSDSRDFSTPSSALLLPKLGSSSSVTSPSKLNTMFTSSKSSGSTVNERSDSGISELSEYSTSVDGSLSRRSTSSLYSFVSDHGNALPEQLTLPLSGGGPESSKSEKTSGLSWQSSVDSAVGEEETSMMKKSYSTSSRRISKEDLLKSKRPICLTQGTHSRV